MKFECVIFVSYVAQWMSETSLLKNLIIKYVSIVIIFGISIIVGIVRMVGLIVETQRPHNVYHVDGINVKFVGHVINLDVLLIRIAKIIGCKI